MGPYAAQKTGRDTLVKGVNAFLFPVQLEYLFVAFPDGRGPEPRFASGAGIILQEASKAVACLACGAAYLDCDGIDFEVGFLFDYLLIV